MKEKDMKDKKIYSKKILKKMMILLKNLKKVYLRLFLHQELKII